MTGTCYSWTESEYSALATSLTIKKGLDKKNITLHVYRAFWYISLRSSVTIASGAEAKLFLAVLGSQICKDRVLSFRNTKQLRFINFFVFSLSSWSVIGLFCLNLVARVYSFPNMAALETSFHYMKL